MFALISLGKQKPNDQHNCRGWLKFEEGNLATSLFGNLEIDFHLIEKNNNYKFANMLVWTRDCCISSFFKGIYLNIQENLSSFQEKLP